MGNGGHAVGGVVGVGADAVAEQVAVVIPGVGHAPCAGHAVGNVVGVVGGARVGGFTQAVAYLGD